MPIDNDDILQIKIKFDASDLDAVANKVKKTFERSVKGGVDDALSGEATAGASNTPRDTIRVVSGSGTTTAKSGKQKSAKTSETKYTAFGGGGFASVDLSAQDELNKSLSGSAKIKGPPALPPPLPKSDKDKLNFIGIARGAMAAMRTAQGGSLMGGVSAAGSLGAAAGAAGFAVGGLAVAVGAAVYAIKKATDIINYAGESLKEYNGNIFAASVQLEYFWMGLKFKVGKYLEDVLPQLMKQSAAMLGELVMTGAVMLKELAPALMAVLKGATIVIGSFAVEMKAVGWTINVFAEIIKSTTIHLLEMGIAAVSFARWVNEKMGPAAVGFMGGGLTGPAAAFAIAKIGGPDAAIHAMQQTIKDIKDGVFNIADNTKKEEEDGFKITAALFSGLKAWSHEKDAKDFGEIKVDGFKAAGNPKNILKDMVGLDPAKDFFLNGAGAAGGARFPGPERHHNNFQAAEKIVFEFDDYDRINFAIQNEVAEMISKCVSASDARFAMIQGGLARITS